MSLTSKLSSGRASTLKISAAAFFEKLEEKIKSRKKTAMDFIKGDVANVLAYNREQEERRIADMARYRGYAQLIDAPLQKISSATGTQFDTDKYYALLSNEDLRNDFLNRIKNVNLDNNIEAQAILNSIQVKGTGSFENKEAVIRELTKPRYKKITQPIKAKTPFGIGEKSFLREQQAFIQSQIGGRPELFSRPGVPEGIPRTDITGTFVDPKILTGGTASNFRSNFKKAEAGYLRNYILSFDKNTQFKITGEEGKNMNDILPPTPYGADPSVNYIGITDEKERRLAKDKVRAEMLEKFIKPLLTANGEIAVEYVSIIQGSGLFSGVGADGKALPSFTDEPLEGRTRVKLNDYYLKQLGLTDKESEVTGVDTDDTGVGADDTGADDTGAGAGADPNQQTDFVVTYSEGYKKRKDDFDKTPPSPLKDFITNNFGYDKPTLPDTENTDENYSKDLQKIQDFIFDEDKKGKKYRLEKDEINMLVDQLMTKYGIEDNEENRDRVKNDIVEGLRVYMTEKDKDAPVQQEVDFNKAKTTHSKYIKRIKKYKSAKEFDDDKEFRTQASEDLVKANLEYQKQIKKLKEKIDSLPLSKIKERNELKGRLGVLEREYQEIREMQDILITRPKVATSIDPKDREGTF